MINYTQERYNKIATIISSITVLPTLSQKYAPKFAKREFLSFTPCPSVLHFFREQEINQHLRVGNTDYVLVVRKALVKDLNQVVGTQLCVYRGATFDFIIRLVRTFLYSSLVNHVGRYFYIFPHHVGRYGNTPPRECIFTKFL